MKKEDILASSRKENKNKDLAELDLVKHANSFAAAVGAMACCVVLLLAQMIADTMLYSPFFIYFSMIGTNWLIRAVRMKKTSDWILTGLWMTLAVLALIGFIARLVEIAV